jgi:hypothetical protein
VSNPFRAWDVAEIAGGSLAGPTAPTGLQGVLWAWLGALCPASVFAAVDARLAREENPVEYALAAIDVLLDLRI